MTRHDDKLDILTELGERLHGFFIEALIRLTVAISIMAFIAIYALIFRVQ